MGFNYHFQKVYQAAKNKNKIQFIHAVEKLLPGEHGGKYFANPIQLLAYENNDEAIQWLTKEYESLYGSADWQTFLVVGYAMAGRVVKASRIAEENMHFIKELIYGLAKGGHNVLALYHKNRYPQYVATFIQGSAEAGNEELVNEFINQQPHLALHAVIGFGLGGFVEPCKKLVSRFPQHAFFALICLTARGLFEQAVIEISELSQLSERQFQQAKILGEASRGNAEVVNETLILYPQFINEVILQYTEYGFFSQAEKLVSKYPEYRGGLIKGYAAYGRIAMTINSVKKYPELVDYAIDGYLATGYFGLAVSFAKGFNKSVHKRVYPLALRPVLDKVKMIVSFNRQQTVEAVAGFLDSSLLDEAEKLVEGEPEKNLLEKLVEYYLTHGYEQKLINLKSRHNNIDFTGFEIYKRASLGQFEKVSEMLVGNHQYVSFACRGYIQAGYEKQVNHFVETYPELIHTVISRYGAVGDIAAAEKLLKQFPNMKKNLIVNCAVSGFVQLTFTLIDSIEPNEREQYFEIAVEYFAQQGMHDAVMAILKDYPDFLGAVAFVYIKEKHFVLFDYLRETFSAIDEQSVIDMEFTKGSAVSGQHEMVMKAIKKSPVYFEFAVEGYAMAGDFSRVNELLDMVNNNYYIPSAIRGYLTRSDSYQKIAELLQPLSFDEKVNVLASIYSEGYRQSLRTLLAKIRTFFLDSNEYNRLVDKLLKKDEQLLLKKEEKYSELIVYSNLYEGIEDDIENIKPMVNFLVCCKDILAIDSRVEAREGNVFDVLPLDIKLMICQNIPEYKIDKLNIKQAYAIRGKLSFFSRGKDIVDNKYKDFKGYEANEETGALIMGVGAKN